MTSLSDVKQAELIEAFKSTSSYLELNKDNTSDTEAPFLDLHLSISNGFISSKIYDKRDDFDFDIVNFSFLDGDVPRSTASRGLHFSVYSVC